MKKQKTQADKYLKLIDSLGLKESTDISSNAKKLIELKTQFDQYNIYELQVIRTEVNSIVEDYKQNTLFTSMITTLLAAVTIIFTFVREQLVLYNIIGLFTPILIIIVGCILISILLIYKNYAGGSRKLNQLMSIIDLNIQERKNIDLLHQEAYKEYNEYLKKRDKIHIF